LKFVPEVRRRDRVPNNGQKSVLDGGIVEKPAAGPGVANAELAFRYAKRFRAASASRHTITTAREPMCFSSQITRGTPAWRKYANASAGCSSKPWRLAGFTGRHGRGQVNQPLGIGGKAGHHLQRGGGVFLPDGHIAVQPGADDPFAHHV
jgi:hypothetical protein